MPKSSFPKFATHLDHWMVASIWQAHAYVSYPMSISHTFLLLEGRQLVWGEPEGGDLGFVFFWPVRATYRPSHVECSRCEVESCWLYRAIVILVIHV